MEQKLTELPKYWCVKATDDNLEKFKEHVIRYLDEIEGFNGGGDSWFHVFSIDYPANRYFGFDGRKEFNGTHSCYDYNFKNNATELTLEEFIELRNKMKDKEIVDNIENKPFSFQKCLMSINDMLEYKNKAYGESALKPLDIFAKHHPYGSRIDEKLARVKYSEDLRKNDIADLLGSLVLICKDRGWDDFSELCD